MIEVPRIPPKPRRHSMLVMSEVGIPMRATEDLIEIAAPLIDYAKITDHVGLSDRLTQEKVAWLAERYGTEFNFASVAPANVVAVDAIRRGIHRKAGYRAMM